MSCANCSELREVINNLKTFIAKNFDAIFYRFDNQDKKLTEIATEFRETFKSNGVFLKSCENLADFTSIKPEPDVSTASATAEILVQNPVSDQQISVSENLSNLKLRKTKRKHRSVGRYSPDSERRRKKKKKRTILNRNLSNGHISTKTINDIGGLIAMDLQPSTSLSSNDNEDNFVYDVTIKEELIDNNDDVSDLIPLIALVEPLRQKIATNDDSQNSKLIPKSQPSATVGAVRKRRSLGLSLKKRYGSFRPLADDDPRGRCPVCLKQLNCIYTLKRHIRVMHPTAVVSVPVVKGISDIVSE